MKKKTLVFILLFVVVALTSWFVKSGGYIFLAIALISILVSLVLTIIKWARKKSNSKWWRFLAIYFSILIFGVLVNLAKPLSRPLDLTSLSVADQLKYAYSTDQWDRTTTRSLIFSDYGKRVIAPRDSMRRVKVYELYNAGRIKTTEEKYDAAFILHHGNDSNDYRLAHQLAIEAFKQDSDFTNLKWLTEATYDRWQRSIGKPQKYGTQHQW